MKVKVLNQEKVLESAAEQLDSHLQPLRCADLALLEINGKYIMTDTECCHYDEFETVIRNGTISTHFMIPVIVKNLTNVDTYRTALSITGQDIEFFFDTEKELTDYLQSRIKTHPRLKSNYRLLLKSIKDIS